MRIDGVSTNTADIVKPNLQSLSDATEPGKVPEQQGTSKDKQSISDMTKLTDLEKNYMSVSDKFVLDTVEKANNAIVDAGRRFEYSIHEKTKQIIVKVIDTATDEVVREIPPEKILNMVAAMWEAAGLFVDEKR